MKGKKEFAVINSEFYTAHVTETIKEMIDSLKQSAEETGLNKDDSFIGETLLLMMFSAKLQSKLFKEDDNTVNTDNESEVTL